MVTSEPDLAAYLDKRDQRLYDRLLLNRFFKGTITAVSGTKFPYQIQVQQGSQPSDGMWHNCTTPGYIPAIGDQVELAWRDKRVAEVVAPLGPVSRVIDNHQVFARVYWTGSTTISTGYNLIPYNQINEDPSGMLYLGGLKAPIAGQYLAVAKGGFSLSSGLLGACAFYRNGSYASQGDGVTGAGDWQAQAVDLFHLNLGDYIQVYLYTATNGVSIISGSDRQFFSLILLVAD